MMKKIWIGVLVAFAAFVTSDALALPKSMRDYSARKLYFTSGTGQVVLADNDSTALIFGDSSNSSIVVIDTTTGTEKLVLNGTIGQDVLRVDSGTVQIDEGLTVGGVFGLTGDLTLSGGVGALTFDAASSSVVLPDDSAAALIFGSPGALDLLTIVTTDDNEALVILGYIGADSLHIDAGTFQCDENADFGAGIDVTGAVTVSTTSDLNGDIAAGGGAGALTFDAASSGVVYTDASATGLLFGSAGHDNLLTLVSTNDQERLVVTGETAVLAFKVDVGLTEIDEAATFGASIEVTTTSDLNGDIAAGGGAGALTFDAASSSVVYTDASATGLLFGTVGHLNLLTLVSTDDQERLVITGETAVLSLHNDMGLTQLDQAVTLGASIEVTTTADMNGDISAGGGAGALTFDAASSSVVYTDDSGTGLLFGSTDHLNLLTLVSSNDTERLIVTGETGVLSFHNDMGLTQLDQAVTMGDTLGVTGITTTTGGLISITGTNVINDISPSATDIDFTAEHQVTFFAKVTGAVMTEVDTEEDFFRIGPLSTYFEVFQDGNDTDFVGTWGDGVTGWVMPGPSAADQGFQLTEGILLGSAHSFTGQTDTMTMRVAFLIGTRAELDVLQAGFRALGAYAIGDDDAEWLAAYDDKVTVGIIDNAGGLKQTTSFATSDVSTGCTHAAAADGDILALEIVVDAAGDTTVSIGTDTPVGGTALQTQTSVTAAYADLTPDTACNATSITLTATEYVPTIALAKAAGGVSTTTIVDYYVGP